MTTSLTIANPTFVQLAGQADNDQHLIQLWLHGRCIRTQQVYLPEVERFVSFIGVPFHQVTLGMIQVFADSLERLRPATRHRILATIKSLFAFGHLLGYLPFDVTRPLRLPAVRETLHERIMDESETLRIILLERNPRNVAILSLLYAAGIRVSELCGLRWMDLQARGDAGQITVLGKGAKTRTILLPSSVWNRVLSIRHNSTEDAPVFRSRKGGAMSREQIFRIVKAATKTAGISKSVSPHWFRHAHATHALERGAPISLVQATLSHASVATTGRYLHARPSDSSSRYLPL